jgi:hypothetical protein
LFAFAAGCESLAGKSCAALEKRVCFPRLD